MKIEQLPSGTYRVRKMYKGQKYFLLFDHKPTQKEIIERLNTEMESVVTSNGTFKSCAEDYIRSRNNVLSPSSVLTYEKLIKAMTDDFKNTKLGSIDQTHVQREINRYSANHAPKSVRALHGFIASVLAVYKPNLTLRTTLPQKVHTERYLPTEEDIKRILDAAKGTEDSIGFQLGVLSLRRAEICALEIDDLVGNELHIHSNLVYNKGWQKKETPKSDAGNRIIYLPEKLAAEIREKGYFFKYSPNKLLEHLQKYQKALDIPKFRFHDLRHYYASYAVTVMPESDVMYFGGWKSDHVFKEIYRESMKDKRKVSAEKFNDKILS